MRVGDYTRERLGLSSREFYSLAQVTEALADHPKLARAFEAGEISWTELRKRVTGTARNGDGAASAAADEQAQGSAAEEGSGTETTQQAPPDQDQDFDPFDESALPEPPPRSFFPDAILHADVAELTLGLSTITAHELDARLRRAVSATQGLDWQTGCLLRTLFSLRLHRELGFASSSLYIRARLQLSVRKARGLVAIERATLLRCPELSRAYRCGRISWLRALAILPVLSEGSGHLWVERAARVTLRRLHDEVTWALNRADATQGRSGLTPPPLGAVIDTSGCDLADVGGDATNNSDSTNEVHFGALRYGNGLSFSSVTIRFFGPITVVAMLDEAIRLTRRPGEPRWRAMERLLRLVMQEWNSQPRHRDPVFERDGWRCSVPACSSRRNLHDHHVVFRSHGGDNSLGNRLSVCAAHHLHGIHERKLHVSCSAPGVWHWQLGTRGGGRPLMELIGEAYLAGAPSEALNGHASTP